jgi:hypothetical protein
MYKLCKLCKECGQPLLKKGQRRRNADDYRHASGCPLDDYKPRTAPSTGAPKGE